MIERHLDYLQFTANFNEYEFTPEEFKTTNGMPYYPRGYRSHNGTRFNFGSNKGMNCFVVLAGEQLQYLRGMGQSDAKTLDWAFANGAKISRLDLAVTEWNTFTGMFMPSDVEMWYKCGLISSALVEGGCKQIADVLKSGNIVETVYIGDLEKRAKRGIFRAYDKGITLDLGQYMASRIELELKREKAHAAALRIERTGDIAGNFRTYFDVKHPEFERIMQAPVYEAKRGTGKAKSVKEEEEEKRWIWLMNQVAPSLKKAIEDDRKEGRGNGRMFEFMQRAGIVKDAEEFAQKWAKFKLDGMLSEKYILD